jgi:hypothetical protein
MNSRLTLGVFMVLALVAVGCTSSSGGDDSTTTTHAATTTTAAPSTTTTTEAVVTTAAPTLAETTTAVDGTTTTTTMTAKGASTSTLPISGDPANVPDLAVTPVEWTIELDDWGPSIHSIYTVVDARPLAIDEVESMTGRLVWDETVVDLCGVGIRAEWVGYVHIGDGYQTTEGCGSNPTAMQDAFDDFDLPEYACAAVAVGGHTYEYCAPLDEV